MSMGKFQGRNLWVENYGEITYPLSYRSQERSSVRYTWLKRLFSKQLVPRVNKRMQRSMEVDSPEYTALHGLMTCGSVSKSRK
eukprot:5478508-Amphidinium_carterae.1